MKKFLTMFILAFLFVANAKADIELLELTAEEAYQVAAEQALGQFSDAELVLAGTINITFEQELFNNTETIELAFDMETGNSTGWLFIFRSAAEPENTITYGTVKVNFGGFGETVSAMPIDSETLDVTPFVPYAPKNAITETWVTPNEMITTFKNSPEYTAFAGNHDEINFLLTIMTKTDEFEDVPSDAPFYTTVVYSGTDTLALVINAVTNEVYHPGAVNDYGVDTELEVYPNPADNYVNVVLDNAVNVADLNIEIVDLYGKSYNVSAFEMVDETNLRVGLGQLSKGKYFVRIRSGNYERTVSVVVAK